MRFFKLYHMLYNDISNIPKHTLIHFWIFTRKIRIFLAINDTIITMMYGYGFLKTWIFENCSLKRNQC